MILLIFAAILAGGIGQRLNSESPKQFIMVGNKPILIHSIEKFLEVDDFNKIIISSPKDFIDYTKELVEKYFPKNDRLVVIEGGAQRKDTINNSIEYAIECGAVPWARCTCICGLRTAYGERKNNCRRHTRENRT